MIRPLSAGLVIGVVVGAVGATLYERVPFAREHRDPIQALRTVESDGEAMRLYLHWLGERIVEGQGDAMATIMHQNFFASDESAMHGYPMLASFIRSMPSDAEEYALGAAAWNPSRDDPLAVRVRTEAVWCLAHEASTHIQSLAISPIAEHSETHRELIIDALSMLRPDIDRSIVSEAMRRGDIEFLMQTFPIVQIEQVANGGR